MSDLTGQSIAGYRILEPIGQGGMAVVYKALDTRLNRPVAVKVIRRGAFPPEMLGQVRKRFEREALALAKLSHPNIVHIHKFGEFDGAPYLVMDYLPGGKLPIRPGSPLPWQEALRLIVPIAQALAYAHHYKIIHRDVKPANILLNGTGQPILTDFGIARIVENQDSPALTGTGMGVGTPEYMAPEQWTGQATPLSDEYSLGVVLYELITGRKPYTADTPAGILLKQASEPLPRPGRFAPDLPNALEQILMKALAKDPAGRFPYMGAFTAALEELLPGQTAAQDNAHAPGAGPAMEHPPAVPLPMIIDPRDSLVKPSRRRGAPARPGGWLGSRRNAGLGVVFLGMIVLGTLALALAGRPITHSFSPASSPTHQAVVVPTNTLAFFPTFTRLPTRTLRPTQVPQMPTFTAVPVVQFVPSATQPPSCTDLKIAGVWRGPVKNDQTSESHKQTWTLGQQGCYVFRVAANGGMDFQGTINKKIWYFTYDGGSYIINGYLSIIIGNTQDVLSGNYKYVYCDACANDSYTVYFTRSK